MNSFRGAILFASNYPLLVSAFNFICSVVLLELLFRVSFKVIPVFLNKLANKQIIQRQNSKFQMFFVIASVTEAVLNEELDKHLLPNKTLIIC